MFAATTIIPKEEQLSMLSSIASKLNAESEFGHPLLVWPDGTKLKLPEPLLQVLIVAAQALTRKQGVSIVVRSEWLTVGEAADIIGCSHQQVIELINTNKLKSIKTDTHNRIRLADLLGFIDVEDQERDQIMADLIAHTEDFGGYDL